MNNPEALLQLARIIGRDQFTRQLGLSPKELPLSLTPEQMKAFHSLAEKHGDAIARALLEEAAACDDVTDAASGMAYLEERLAFLGDLLSEETRQHVRDAFASVAKRWG